jgi:hypothetical protein
MPCPSSGRDSTTTMHACVELAGFAAAHAVCCIFGAGPLRPLAFSERADTAARKTELAAGTPDDIAANTRLWLDANVDRADQAVVVVDGYVTIAGVKTDALILDIRSYRVPVRNFRMAIPYRHGNGRSGFVVHRPKFIVAHMDEHDASALTEAFFRGVWKHGPGSRIWNACIDPSW